MSSPKSGEEDWPYLDARLGIEATAEDVRALRAHRPGPMTYPAYLAFLRSFPAPSTEALRRRRGPQGEPFRLPEEG